MMTAIHRKATSCTAKKGKANADGDVGFRKDHMDQALANLCDQDGDRQLVEVRRVYPRYGGRQCQSCVDGKVLYTVGMRSRGAAIGRRSLGDPAREVGQLGLARQDAAPAMDADARKEYQHGPNREGQ